MAGVDEARIEVYRRGPQGPEFCGRIMPDEFSLDLVRSHYGGGRFDLRLVRRNRYVKGKSVSIAGPVLDLATRMEPEDKRGREERREAEEDARRERLQGLSVADSIAELRRDFRDMLGAIRNPPPAAYQADPVTMFVELSKNMQSMMRPYVDALQTRREERDPGDVVELIRLGMDLAEGRGGKDRDPYAQVLKEVGLPLLRMLAPGVQAPPTTETSPTMPPEPTTALEALRPWLPTLIHWAARGTDPRLRADVILEELPERFSDMLATFLSGPEAETTFFNAFPDTMPHRVWFEGLIFGLRVAYGIIQEEEEKAEPTPPAILGGPSS